MLNIFWIFTGNLYHIEQYLLKCQWNIIFLYIIYNIYYLCFVGLCITYTYIVLESSAQWSRSICPGKLSTNKWNWLAPQNTAFLIASCGLVSKLTANWKYKIIVPIKTFLILLCFHFLNFRIFSLLEKLSCLYPLYLFQFEANNSVDYYYSEYYKI